MPDYNGFQITSPRGLAWAWLDAAGTESTENQMAFDRARTDILRGQIPECRCTHSRGSDWEARSWRGTSTHRSITHFLKAESPFTFRQPSPQPLVKCHLVATLNPCESWTYHFPGCNILLYSAYFSST